MSSIKYRPEIDGLRAVAVIPVVLFHLGFSWISGGYLGVDVFFVISGFLITSILLKESSTKTFSYVKFWVRRIRRILPALLTMVTVILIASYFIVFKPNLKLYSVDATSAIFSYANIAMLLNFGDYWGPAAETSPFLHAWSLSVEEQFYILYPAFIVLLYFNKNRLFNILLGVTALSFALFLYAAFAYPMFGFYLLPTRAWELAFGGLLAMRIGEILPLARFKNIWPTIGMVLIIVSYFFFPGSGAIGINAALPVIGSVLIIGYASADEPIGKILGNNVIVYIGKISYSLYLWHWPLIVLSKQYPHRLDYNPTYYLLFLIVITAILSVLSYRLVEVPTRKMKRVLTLVCVQFAVCLAVIFAYKGLVSTTYKPAGFEQTKFYGLYYDVTPKIAPLTAEAKAKRLDIFAPPRSDKYKDAYAQGGIIMGEGPANPSIILVGDSHGAMWGKVVDEIGGELNVKRSFYSTVGNNPFFPIPYKPAKADRKGFSASQRNKYAEGIINNLNTWKPKVLIVSSKWSTRSGADFANLESLIKLAAANNTTVLLFNQPPIIDAIGDNNSGQYLSFMGYKPNGTNQYVPLNKSDGVAQKNNDISALAKKYPNCRVVDINSLFKHGNDALVVKDKAIMYYDDDHLSYQGTQVAKATIKQAIENALATNGNKTAL